MRAQQHARCIPWRQCTRAQWVGTTTTDLCMPPAHVQLVKSGERERLKQLLRDKLTECGWRDEVKQRCRGAGEARQLPHAHSARLLWRSTAGGALSYRLKASTARVRFPSLPAWPHVCSAQTSSLLVALTRSLQRRWCAQFAQRAGQQCRIASRLSCSAASRRLC
jgi:Transcription factor e(y)2